MRRSRRGIAMGRAAKRRYLAPRVRTEPMVMQEGLACGKANPVCEMNPPFKS